MFSTVPSWSNTEFVFAVSPHLLGAPVAFGDFGASSCLWFAGHGLIQLCQVLREKGNRGGPAFGCCHRHETE